MNKKIIGCDIGGVVRNMMTFEPIDQSIETINKLSEDFEIIFISKCKESYKNKTLEWLKLHSLDKYKVLFCETYEEKEPIVKAEKVSIMIDDRITVLMNMKNLNVTKLWFCNDDQKINGAKKYNATIFNDLTLVRTWDELYEFVKN